MKKIIAILSSMLPFLCASEGSVAQGMMLDGVKQGLLDGCAAFVDSRTKAWGFFLPFIIDASLTCNTSKICNDYINKFLWERKTEHSPGVAGDHCAGYYRYELDAFNARDYPIVACGSYDCSGDGRFSVSIDDVWPVMVANDHLIPITIPGATVNYKADGTSGIISLITGAQMSIEPSPYRPSPILGGYGFIDFLQEINGGLGIHLDSPALPIFSWDSFPASFSIYSITRPIAMPGFMIRDRSSPHDAGSPITIPLNIPRSSIRVTIDATRINDFTRLTCANIDMGAIGHYRWHSLGQCPSATRPIGQLIPSWKDGLPNIHNGSIRHIADETEAWIRDPEIIDPGGFSSRVKFYHAVFLYTPDQLLRWFSATIHAFPHGNPMRDYVEFECAFLWLVRYRHPDHAAAFKVELAKHFAVLPNGARKKYLALYMERSEETTSLYELGRREVGLFNDVKSSLQQFVK